MFKIDCIGATFQNRRFNNEDNYYIENRFADIQHGDERFSLSRDDKIKSVYGVFDGLGGEKNGEEASYYAAETLSQFPAEAPIEKFYTIANEKVCSLRGHKSSKMTGTTAVILEIRDGRYICSNIGDSRGYIIRNNRITQLSQDHTSIQMLINSGLMTDEDLKNSKYHNVLSQCLGINDEEMIISPYIAREEKLHSKDIFLLCSDGLTGELSDDELKDIILNTPREAVLDRLFERAVEAGAKDNVTIVLIYVSKKGLLKGLFGKKAL